MPDSSMGKAEVSEPQESHNPTGPQREKTKKLHLYRLIAPITYGVGIVAAIIIFGVAKLLLSLSAGHEWFSSYVEIAFGLNAGLSLSMFRKWCLNHKGDLKRHKRKLQSMHDCADKKAAAYINSRMLRYIRRIDYCFTKDTKGLIVMARCFCLFSLVLLVSGSSEWFLPFATLLILPLVMYYVAYKLAGIIFFQECFALFVKVRFCIFPILKHGSKLKLYGLNEYTGEDIGIDPIGGVERMA